MLVCDCGGGTVDITTYTIIQAHPQLIFDELCTGVGGKCGSTYIDRNFQALLRNRFGRDYERLPLTKKGPGSAFMNCFELIKRSFGSHIADSGGREDPEESTVVLSYSDLVALFDPVVKDIIRLVSHQINKARQQSNAKITRVILVGGFGESPYLYTALENWCRGNGNIRLMCPVDPQAAVVRGAALRGLEGLRPRMKQARMHYGFSRGDLFRQGIDSEEHAYIDHFYQRKLCRGRMKWAVTKGEPIFKETQRTFGLCCPWRSGKLVIRLPLYSCALEEAPERADDARVVRAGTLITTFPADYEYGSSFASRWNPIRRAEVHQISIEIQVKFGDRGENLTYRTVVNGKIEAMTRIEFNQR